MSGAGSLADFLARLDGTTGPPRSLAQRECDEDMARERRLAAWREREGFQPTGVPGVWRKVRSGEIGPRR